VKQKGEKKTKKTWKNWIREMEIDRSIDRSIERASENGASFCGASLKPSPPPPLLSQMLLFGDL